MMAVAPGSFMQEIADFSLLYPLQLLHYYHLTGDISFVKEMLPIAEGVVDYFKRYERNDGLIEKVTDKWNLVDWPDNLRDGYDFELTKPIGDGCHNVINTYYYGAMTTVNKLRGLLDLGKKYESEEIKVSFLKAFYNEETKSNINPPALLGRIE